MYIYIRLIISYRATYFKTKYSINTVKFHTNEVGMFIYLYKEKSWLGRTPLPMMLAFWRRRQDERTFEDSLVYLARLKAIFEFSVYD